MFPSGPRLSKQVTPYMPQNSVKLPLSKKSLGKFTVPSPPAHVMLNSLLTVMPLKSLFVRCRGSARIPGRRDKERERTKARMCFGEGMVI